MYIVIISFSIHLPLQSENGKPIRPERDQEPDRLCLGFLKHEVLALLIALRQEPIEKKL